MMKSSPARAPEGMTGNLSGSAGSRSAYEDHTAKVGKLIDGKKGAWNGINAESVARMRLQNRFQTGLDIARYTAGIMRADMAAYDADPALYTQSLGAWHGFIAQQQMIAVKKHFGTTKRRYIYLSGWMVAALRSEFGPLPDQSMHEKTSVPALIEEIYTFLRQADARELGDLFRALDAAREAGDARQGSRVAGAGRELRDACRADHRRHRRGLRQCGGDLPAGQEDDRGGGLRAADREPGLGREAVRPPGRQGHRAARGLHRRRSAPCRYAFLELGVDDGIIVTRTDSLGAGLTKQIAVSHTPGDLGDQYNSFLDCEEVTPETARNGDVLINRDGKMLRPKRLPSNLYQFRAGTGATAACWTASPRCRTAPTCCGSRPRSRISSRSRHDGPHPRRDPERQAGLQQLALVQLDAELPPAGVRRLGGGRQGRERL